MSIPLLISLIKASLSSVGTVGISSNLANCDKSGISYLGISMPSLISFINSSLSTEKSLPVGTSGINDGTSSLLTNCDKSGASYFGMPNKLPKSIPDSAIC